MTSQVLLEEHQKAVLEIAAARQRHLGVPHAESRSCWRRPRHMIQDHDMDDTDLQHDVC